MSGHYDNPEIAKAYIKFRSAHPTALVDHTLNYLRKGSISDQNKSFDLMIDVGCGSGQVCNMFVSYFKQITAIDISVEQIKVGKENNQFDNIHYEIGSAECLPASDNSVDLVIAGGAAHWFDLKKFFREVERVLKPTGCLAMFGFTINKISLCDTGSTHDNLEKKAENAGSLVTELLQLGLSDDDYARNACLEAFNRFVNIFEAIPFVDKKRIDGICSACELTFEHLEGMVKSFDYYENFKNKKIQEFTQTDLAVNEEDADLSKLITRKLSALFDINNVNLKNNLKLEYDYYLLLTRPTCFSS